MRRGPWLTYLINKFANDATNSDVMKKSKVMPSTVQYKACLGDEDGEGVKKENDVWTAVRFTQGSGES